MENLPALKKELETVHTALKIVIKTDEDLSKASDAIKQTIALRKKVTEEKEDYTKPAREIVDKANKIYNPYIEACTSAEQKLKTACAKYMQEREAERRVKEEKIAKDLQSGKIKKTETALRKMDALPPAPTKATGTQSTLQMVKRKKLDIVDSALLPREYLIPDTKKIEQVLRAGVVVPGARLVDVITTASYGS